MKRLTICALVVSALLINACGNTSAKPTATVAPTLAATATVAATPTPPTPTTAPTPTLAPLGTAANPIIVSLPPATTAQEILTSGELLAQQLSEAAGLTIKVNTPASYTALTEAMNTQKIHLGYFTPFAYVYAKQKANVEVSVITLRNELDRSAILFVANAAAKYTPAKDEKEIEVLKQFTSKKPCWTETTSASGYVIPLGILNKQGVKYRTGAAFLQGDTVVVKALYFSARADICDFGAVIDDARNGVLKDYYDVRDRVNVIYKTEPLIPNNTFAFAKEVPNDIRSKILAALFKVAQNKDGKEYLRTVYQAEGIKTVSEEAFTNFKVYWEASGVELNTLFK